MSDPFSVEVFGFNVLAGLVTNAISSVVGQVIRDRNDSRQRLIDLRGQLLTDQTLSAIVAKAAASVGKHLPDIDQRDRLRGFLVSPEAEAIVRQLFTVRVGSRDSDSQLTSTIQDEFTEALAEFLNTDRALDIGATLFDAILNAINLLLEKGIHLGSLTAHEAKSSMRFGMLRNELQAIHRAVQSLQNTPVTVESATAFEKQLRSAVASRHCTIVPPHFDTAVKVPIDEIFVSPRLTIASPDKKKKVQEVGLYDVLSGVSRLVVLGNPGGGKSTLATKICHDLASRYAERLASGRELTPIIVVLREYGADRKEKPISILDFIEAIVRSKYQLHAGPGIVEYLLLSGRVMVIFDGLDELLDTSYRREVSANVESFCNVYGNVPVIVTSREVGYEQSPLDERVFDLCRLSPFNDLQVQQYAQKWFALDLELAEAQKIEKAQTFLRESASVADLRSNPLMLALLCNIYRGENYIPQNRPDVYEKCAVMLFEKWDPSRGIHVELPFQAHIRPALMYVAHWIYGDEKLQAGVGESQLVAKTKEYLWPRRFEDADEAIAAAKMFVEFCRGRAWVFTDTGTAKDGESLYQFTHRTFLEYFAAAYLVRTNETADALYEELAPRIEAREWDVIAQLAFQIKNKASEEAADRLLTLLLQDGVMRNVAGRPTGTLSFAARSLEFLVPSPRVTRQLVASVIHVTTAFQAMAVRNLGIAAHERSRPLPGNRALEVEGTFAPLLRVARENRLVVLDELEKSLIEGIRNADELIAATAADLLFGMKWALPSEVFSLERDPARSGLDAIADRVLAQEGDRIRFIASRSIVLSLRLHWMQHTSLEEFLARHGVEGLFVAPRALFFSDMSFISISSNLIGNFVDLVSETRRYPAAEMSSRVDDLNSDLAAVGQALLSHQAPWAPGESPMLPFDFRPDRTPNFEILKLLKPGALFGLFCLITPLVEKSTEVFRESAISRLVPSAVAMSWRARSERKFRSVIHDELQKLGFRDEQVTFVTQWASGTVNTVK